MPPRLFKAKIGNLLFSKGPNKHNQPKDHPRDEINGSQVPLAMSSLESITPRTKTLTKRCPILKTRSSGIISLRGWLNPNIRRNTKTNFWKLNKKTCKKLESLSSTVKRIAFRSNLMKASRESSISPWWKNKRLKMLAIDYTRRPKSKPRKSKTANNSKRISKDKNALSCPIFRSITKCKKKRRSLTRSRNLWRPLSTMLISKNKMSLPRL